MNAMIAANTRHEIVLLYRNRNRLRHVSRRSTASARCCWRADRSSTGTR
jgi:hypothetical protein